MKRINEVFFWKTLAGILGLGLFGMLMVNMLFSLLIPPQVSSFVLSSLFCIGVGYSVVSPSSSLTILAKKEEKNYQKSQRIAGLLTAVIVSLTFLYPEVRNTPQSWGLVPIILLPITLMFRKLIFHRGNDK